MITVKIKDHPNKMITVIYPNGEYRLRNCGTSAVPSERRPVQRVAYQHLRKAVKDLNRIITPEDTAAMTYREYNVRRNLFFGLFLLVCVIAFVYFCIKAI